MNSYQYPLKELVPDYLRAGFGFFVPVGLMLFADLAPLVFYVLAGLALLFGIYGLRTALRQATVLSVDGNGLRQEGPLGAVFDRYLCWADLRDLRLRYFSTRRDHKQGWMQLILRAADDSASHGPIRLDSDLHGFDDIVRMAYDVSERRGLPVDPTSASNLAAMGLGDGEPHGRSHDAAITS
mgnify:FL=1